MNKLSRALEKIDALPAPAGARDAVTDALMWLRSALDCSGFNWDRDQWEAADASLKAALTGKADGGDSTDYDCPDCGKRNYKPYRCLNCGYDPLAHKSTQPAPVVGGDARKDWVVVPMNPSPSVLDYLLIPTLGNWHGMLALCPVPPKLAARSGGEVSK